MKKRNKQAKVDKRQQQADKDMIEQIKQDRKANQDLKKETKRYIKKIITETIDTETGEVISSNDKIVNNDIDMSKFNKDKEKRFSHIIYIEHELLFNIKGLSKATISRLIYLSTYANYSNQLVRKGSDGNLNVPMTKKDMEGLMKLSRATFHRFFDELIDKGLLIPVIEGQTKYYKVNGRYIYRGSMSNYKREYNKRKIKYTRMYHNTIRQLYEGSNTRQHKTLAYIFQLIPYIHYNYNCICLHTEVWSTTRQQQDILNLEQICELLGLSTYKSDIKRFERELLKFTFTFESGEQAYLFKHVFIKDYSYMNDCFIINPYVIYSGNNKELRDCIANLLVFDKPECIQEQDKKDNKK